ncbi:MAG TPA: cyclopropane-fatty-acyl-phospholipid synthase family protein [Terriglobales bacterium]|jgi:cyclopropane-fatty-acyl-phospholipid synthase|nr:cyclopropane-fatty-acyl-phospholipid synthase family protein [Terriglobales bacterium]
MGLRAWNLTDPIAHKTLHFLQELLRDYHPRDFTVELWDASRWAPETDQFSRFTWRINHPGALRAALSPRTQLALAEAYIYGDFDIEGDIAGVFPLADYFLGKEWNAKEKLRLSSLLLGLPSRGSFPALRPLSKLHGRLHSRERDRQAVTYHYDVSNEFYQLWLDQNLVYSCAYFKERDNDLDTAQTDKLDYLCRKLRLQAGERLLDIGCGWGGLVLHAAREYGVHALGITLSQPQLEFATERIRRASLSDRCQVRLLDYRELDEPGAYDKVVSVGMVEHVGESRLPEYFSRVFRLLRPGGVFLNHGIGRAGNRPLPDQPTFTDVYVFPDGDLVPIGTTLQAAEGAGFEVCDVENLREHYALTLRHWVRRLENHAEQARRVAGEIKYRIWRLYMAGSAHYFRNGRLDVYQSLLVKSDNGGTRLPLTRRDWYQERALK